MNKEIELGDKVRDLITGYEGIAVAKTEFINGCIQFSVAKQFKKGSAKIPEFGDPSIDSKSLRIIQKKAVDLNKEVEEEKPKIKHTGGPTTITKKMRGY